MGIVTEPLREDRHGRRFPNQLAEQVSARHIHDQDETPAEQNGQGVRW